MFRKGRVLKMAKLNMKRIEIIAQLSERKKIIEYLQRRGVVELTDGTEEGLEKLDTAGSVAQFEKAREDAAAAQAVLGKYAPVKKPMLASFNGPSAWKKDDFAREVQRVSQSMKMCYDINRLQADNNEAKAEIVRIAAMLDQLQSWRTLDLPTDFGGTRRTAAFIGTVPYACEKEALEEKLEHPAEIEIIAAASEQTNLFVLCLHADEDAVYQTLREAGFAPAGQRLSCPPAEQIAQYEAQIAQLEQSIEQGEEAIIAYAGREAEFEFLLDYYDMRAQKYRALHSLMLTKHTFVVQGYIPEKYAEKIIGELEAKYTVAVEISQPEEEEDVPVLLENNAFVRPVESVTEMYAMPSKADIDPNPVMSFFYYFFFGMMLSDAGYGLLMVIGCSIALKKFNLTKRMRNNMQMFLYCGLSTMFWGTMFGSWFGDIIPIIFTEFLHRPAPNLAVWMDPVADPMRLLIVCFALGIVHLLAGVWANFYKLWKAGQKLDALCESIPITLAVLGAAPLAGTMLAEMPAPLLAVAPYLAIAGVVLIVLTAGRSGKGIIGKLGGGLGLNGLYGIVTGYLGDIISYSRLLALGLCTGIIASVVNMLGTIPESPVMKGILLAFVFIFGHALNMAINVLGAYVHANRLQFVEMFGKFYEGGGRAFQPFRMKTKYITFKEDLLND